MRCVIWVQLCASVQLDVCAHAIACCAGEGPCGLIICPSRELARQTHEVILGYTSQLAAAGYPQLHTLLCIGGVDMKEQTDKFKHAGER